MYTITEEYNIS